MSKVKIFNSESKSDKILGIIKADKHNEVVFNGVTLTEEQCKNLASHIKFTKKMDSIVFDDVKFNSQENNILSEVIQAIPGYFSVGYHTQLTNISKLKISNIKLFDHKIVDAFQHLFSKGSIEELSLSKVHCVIDRGIKYQDLLDGCKESKSLHSVAVDLLNLSSNAKIGILKSLQDAPNLKNLKLGAQMINYGDNNEKLPEELVDLIKADKLETFSCAFGPSYSKTKIQEFTHLIAHTNNLKKCNIGIEGHSLTAQEAKMLDCVQKNKNSGVEEFTVTISGDKTMSLDEYISHKQAPAIAEDNINLSAIHDYLESTTKEINVNSQAVIKTKFAINLALEVIKQKINDGTMDLDDIVGKIEYVIKLHPIVGTDNSDIYKHLSQLYLAEHKKKSDEGYDKKSNTYALKAQIRDFTELLKNLFDKNKEFNAANNFLNKTLFEKIDLDIDNDYHMAVEDVAIILYFNPELIRKISSEKIAEFFADQGYTKTALSYLPGNYDYHYEIQIKNENFLEFIKQNTALNIAAVSEEVNILPDVDDSLKKFDSELELSGDDNTAISDDIV